MSSQEIRCPMERSKTRLLTRDIASIEEAGGEVTSELLSQTTSTPFSFIGARYRTSAIQPRQQTHIPSVHDHDTSRHNDAPMIHASLPFSHAFNPSCFTFVCLSYSLWLTWLTNPALVTSVYPNRMQYTPCVLQEASLLDGVDASVRGNGRRFSKTSSYPPCRRYAFNHFYHYFLTTSSSPLFLLIHSFPRPTHPVSCYKSFPHSLSPLFPQSFYQLTTSGNIF